MIDGAGLAVCWWSRGTAGRGVLRWDESPVRLELAA